MKINVTKNEYRTLVDMIEIADWILHAQRTEQLPETLKYIELRKKILSFSKEMGMEHLIHYDKQQDEYFETQEYEESAGYLGYIEEYEDGSFWDILSSRLALRDLEEQEGTERLRQMLTADLADRRFGLETWYDEEFIENGLENLRLVGEKNYRKERSH